MSKGNTNISLWEKGNPSNVNKRDELIVEAMLAECIANKGTGANKNDGREKELTMADNVDDGICDTHTTVCKTTKKRISDEKNTKVYGYMKKKILNHLEENGCSKKEVEKVIESSKFNKDAVLEYMNQRIQMAQMNVHEECQSLSFTNIESWLELFKKWRLQDFCLYEQAMVINSIANNEDLPPPEELEGVDLKSVYRFIGNALLGLPQPKLDARSAEFLANEFELLVGEANTEAGDKDTLRIREQLKTHTELPGFVQIDKCSTDPLGLGVINSNR
uniref:Uncharacterized protein n=3 Tax=Ceratitis capitata TaxID=7213 RepID=W8BT02_CERCA